MNPTCDISDHYFENVCHGTGRNVGFFVVTVTDQKKRRSKGEAVDEIEKLKESEEQKHKGNKIEKLKKLIL